MRILTVNAGSSSLKAAVHEVNEESDNGALPTPPEWHHDATDAKPGGESLESSFEMHVHTMLRDLQIDAVGHRIVHGGLELVHAERITPKVRAAIVAMSDIAPMHNAPALAGIDAVTRMLGHAVPQVAVFDTAFHSTMPPAAYTYAGPFEWLAQGIRRYGFHGISHHYASQRARVMLARDASNFRVVTCHLGSGCSLAAVQNGRSVDTTMGFSPLDGVPMAKRSGSIDPGIMIYLLRRGGHTAATLDDLLNHESGLAGLSGTDGDMRNVLSAIDEGSERARLAFDVYVHRVCAAIAAMAASMNGLDALVFTGGVGEHSPRARAGICQGLGFLGATLDATLNGLSQDDAILSARKSRVVVLKVSAQENWSIAQECFKVLGRAEQGRAADVGALTATGS